MKVTKILKISAPYCGPCRQLKKQLENFNLVPIFEYDADESPEICEQYKVRNIPTLIFLDESNNEVHRIVGLTTSKIIESIITKLNG